MRVLLERLFSNLLLNVLDRVNSFVLDKLDDVSLIVSLDKRYIIFKTIRIIID